VPFEEESTDNFMQQLSFCRPGGDINLGPAQAATTAAAAAQAAEAEAGTMTFRCIGSADAVIPELVHTSTTESQGADPAIKSRHSACPEALVQCRVSQFTTCLSISPEANLRRQNVSTAPSLHATEIAKVVICSCPPLNCATAPFELVCVPSMSTQPVILCLFYCFRKLRPRNEHTRSALFSAQALCRALCTVDCLATSASISLILLVSYAKVLSILIEYVSYFMQDVEQSATHWLRCMFSTMWWTTRVRINHMSSAKLLHVLALTWSSCMVSAADFTTKATSQSILLAAGPNTIMVAIQTDAHLAQADSSAATRSWLTSAPNAARLALTNDEISRADLFSDGSTKGTGPDTHMVVIQALLFYAIMCALFNAFDSLIDHSSSKKRMNLRRIGILLFLLGLASNIVAVGALSFTTKIIGQSNSAAGASNTITVTLVSDTALLATGGSVVTVSGLNGAFASSPVTLVDAGDDGETIFSDGTTQGKGAWSSGTLTLTVSSGGTLVASTTYTFRFQITNPATAQLSPAISIAASGTATIASAAMAKPGTALYGVPNGADPLTVVVPSLSLKSIQQSTPVSGATNTLTVSLTANFNLATGSTVTITGLTQSQTADSASLTVSSTSSQLGTSGTWTQSTGQLVLTAASGGTASGTACVVTFTLNNTATAQLSPAVSVSAAIKDGSGNSVSSIAPAAMAKPGTTLYGVPNGADPLTVVVPSLSLKSIQQSDIMAGVQNTLTVSLTANFNLATGSTVTITGLTQSQTADSASLTVSSTSSQLGTSGTWTQSTGQLVLTAASGGTASETACVVTFDLYNPNVAQLSPAVSVSAAIKDGSGNSVGSIAPAAMTKPGTTLYGAANGADPLTVVNQAISVTTSSNAGVTSSSSVTLTGTRTGLTRPGKDFLTGKARFGFTACEATIWLSDTHAVCKVPSGAFSSQLVVVTVGENAVPVSKENAVSYDQAMLSSVQQANLAPTGQSSITIHGANMGSVRYTLQARGHTGCEASEWVSDSAVRCKIGQGAGETRREVVTAGQRGGSATEAWSYDAAGGMSRVAVSNVGGSGGASVTVHGRNLGGKGGYTVGARAGHTGCEASTWVSDSAVQYRIGQGAGETRRGVVTAGERGGSASQLWSVDIAELSRIRRLNYGGTGSASMTVHGSSMGMVAYTARGREGHTGCEGTQWESETSVRCLLAMGHQGSRRIDITSGSRLGSLSQGWSVDMDVISLLRTSNGAGTGSASVTVHGAAFSIAQHTARGRTGHTRFVGTSWQSETSVRCRVGHGAFGTRRVVMTVGSQGGSTSEAWSIDKEGISLTRKSNSAGTGSASVTVHGSGLFLARLTSTARLSWTGCQATDWGSETSVRCRVGQGGQGTRRLVMTVGQSSGSVSQAWSVDVDVISLAGQSNRAGTGSASVTVHGAGMGIVRHTAKGRAGHTGCEGTDWQSETSVRCRVGHGSGLSRRVVMTVGSQGGSVTEAWSADGSGLSRLRRSNVAGAGAASMTVHGSSMGIVRHTAKGRAGHTGCEGTDWQSETSVRCRVAVGHLGSRRVVVTAGSQAGSISQAWSVDRDAISLLRSSNRAGTGSASVTVHGAGFEIVRHTAEGRAGHTGCEGTEWESETSVRCLASRGAFGTVRVVMTLGSQGGSRGKAWSVDRDAISLTSSSNRAGTGAASVTVHGTGLSLTGLTSRVRVSWTGCQATDWGSETSVRCRVGHGAQGTRRLVMTVGQGSGSVSQAWSVDVDVISLAGQSNRAGTGSASVTVHGAGMGIVRHTAKGRAGHTGCEGTDWQSETSVRCRVGHGSGLSRRVVMTVGSQGGSVTEAWSADGSGLSRLRRSNVAGSSAASMTVHGSSMGIVRHTAKGRAGHTGCEGTDWQSETSVRCRVAVGHLGSRRVVVTAGSQAGSISQAWSVDRDAISLLRSSNRAGTGSASVTVHGAGFGIVRHTAEGRAGHTGCEGTEWESETSVRCLASRGTFGTVRFVMTFSSQAGSRSHAWSVDRDAISLTSSSNRAGTGAASVTVHGSGLSLTGLTSRVRVSWTGCQATDWGSETSVRCRVGHGAQGTRRLVMTVGQGSGSVSQAWSVDVDVISLAGQSNRAGTGSASVTVHGAGMGIVRHTAKGRAGHTGCEGTDWQSETSVRCRVGHGSRLSRRVVMTVGSQGGSVTEAWSADLSRLSRLHRSNVAGAGTASMTVHGSSMGIVRHTAKGRAGHTGCEGTDWQSETSVRCRVGHGSGLSRRVVMTVGSQGGSVTEAWSADGSGLSRLRRSNRAGTSLAPITVHGSSMGIVRHTAKGRAGHTGCEGTDWQSETSVRCVSGLAGDASLRLIMTVGDHVGSLSQAWSVDFASLSVSRRSNRAGTGSESVTVHGAGLGIVQHTVTGQTGHTGCEGTEWESETSVRCLASRGAFGTLRVVMTFSSQAGSRSHAWSVDRDAISLTSSSNRAGTGAASVTVHGSGLSLTGLTSRVRVSWTGCQATDWGSETSVRCRVGHGAQGTRRLVMTVGQGSGSVSQAWSVDVDVISLAGQSNRAGTGSASVTVHGAGMGIVRHTAKGRAGHTGCEGTDWQSETSVRCRVGHGSGLSRRVVMTVGSQGGSVTEAWSADGSGLSRLRRSNVAGSGAASMTVHGSSMGIVRHTAKGRAGHTGCEGTDWQSETSVRCRVAVGHLGSRRVVVTAGSQAGSISQAWSVDRDAISLLRSSNRAGTGSASVTVHGAGFGIVRHTAEGRAGHTGCEGTEWESETSVRCLASRGAFGTVRVVMTLGSQGGSRGKAWSVDRDAISLTSSSNRAGTGAASVTVHGSGLSLTGLTSRVRVSWTGCQATDWGSETSVRCRVGHGAQGTRRLVMTVGQGSGSVSQAWSVDVDMISLAGQSNRAGTGSASVTVHGAGMGIVRHTAKGRAGHTGCEGTDWQSETSVRCRVGHGSGLSRRVVMTVGSQGGSVTEAWSADGSGLSRLRRSNVAGSGAASMTMHGSSMGIVRHTAKGRAGHTGCEGTDWQSETSVRCRVAVGHLGSRRVVVTAGSQAGSISQAGSVDRDAISLLRSSNRAGTGSASVTVHGAGFGIVRHTAEGRAGHTGCEGTEWESETSVRCLASRGAFGTVRVVMTLGSQGGSRGKAWSVDRDAISLTSSSNRAGTGAASVTVHGSGLSLTGLTSRVRVSWTGCQGHRLGVRDIGEMPSRSRSSGHTTAGHDGRPGQRQCESGMVCGRRCDQPGWTVESGWDGIGVCDRAWCGDGDCAAHGEGVGRGTRDARAPTGSRRHR
jgi:hypothetical protein